MSSFYYSSSKNFVLKFSKKESELIELYPNFKEILEIKIDEIFGEIDQNKSISIPEKIENIEQKLEYIDQKLSKLSKLCASSFRLLTTSNLEDHNQSETIKYKILNDLALTDHEKKLSEILSNKYRMYSDLIENLWGNMETLELTTLYKSPKKGEDNA